VKLFLVIPTLKQGGAERVMSELANNLAQKETLNVHLVLLAKSEDFYEISNNVTVYRLGFENKGRINKVLSEVRTFKRLRKILKTHKPDAVLSFMEKYNSFTILASAFLGLHIFVSDRSNPLKRLPKSTELLRKLTYKYATGIIAQTQFAKDILEVKTKNKNIRVIPNPVKKIKSYPAICKKKIILNVGRLVPEKGQKYLIEAFSKLDNNKDWKLLIFGDGPLRNELINQIKKLNLENQVELMGSVKNIDKWLAKASIFVFPSISEGFPNALAEAMVSGLPVVSFDCNAGPREIIVDGVNGILVPAGNINQMTIEVNQLIINKNLRIKLGQNASKIKVNLDINVIATQYLNFLKNEYTS